MDEYGDRLRQKVTTTYQTKPEHSPYRAPKKLHCADKLNTITPDETAQLDTK